MEPDSLRGTPLARFTNVDAADACKCGHPFSQHGIWIVGHQNVYAKCAHCVCTDYQKQGQEISTVANSNAQKTGFDHGRKLAAVFVVREDASYQAKVELGMVYARSQGMDLENGAAFVSGFIDGISSEGRKAPEDLTLEQKFDELLKRLDQKSLRSGPDSDGPSVPVRPE